MKGGRGKQEELLTPRRRADGGYVDHVFFGAMFVCITVDARATCTKIEDVVGMRCGVFPLPELFKQAKDRAIQGDGAAQRPMFG